LTSALIQPFPVVVCVFAMQIIKLTPKAYGCTERRFKVLVEETN
jgi:hypothetical protein